MNAECICQNPISFNSLIIWCTYLNAVDVCQHIAPFCPSKLESDTRIPFQENIILIPEFRAYCKCNYDNLPGACEIMML